MAADVQKTIEAVWRIESPRLIAALARRTRDVGTAEDLAQEALLAALEQWPDDGIPENPGAWLMAAAKRRAVDHYRRQALHVRKQEQIAREKNALLDTPDMDSALDDNFGDDMLRLIFTSCHPVLSFEAQAALALRLLVGLTTGEIARAFLVPEATIAQRIVRAKKTLADSRVPYEVPRGDELRERLAAVLQVIYLIFNEGYAATAGDDWMRPALCEDALRLGRMLEELLPDEPEVHGLAALMEIQASRTAARIDATGAPILLLDQNRTLWNSLFLHRGLAALERARQSPATPGPYELQAQIAACHARALSADQTDWQRIADHYVQLAAISPSPIVSLNLAVAVSFAHGPAAALPLVEHLEQNGALANYHLLPSVHGDLLFKLGRCLEARGQFERAAALAENRRERELLLRRALACGRSLPSADSS